jgi:hypothetical protein
MISLKPSFKNSIIIFLLLPMHSFAQDITGLWKGYLKIDTTSLPYELVISKSGEDLTGYSITVFMIDNVENIGVKSIVLKNKNGNIFVEDKDLVFNNYTTPPKRVKQYNYLVLEKADSIMTLSGTFRTRSWETRSYSGTVHLQKKNNDEPSKLISKLEEIDLMNTLSFMKPNTKTNQQVAIAEVKTIPAKEKGKEIVSAPVKKESKTIIQKPKEEDMIVKNQPVSQTKLKDAVSSGTLIKKPQPSPIKEKTVAISKPAADKKVKLSTPQQKTIASVPVKKQIPENISIAVPELSKRKIETIRTVSVTSDSLLLSLFDNGEIDGDTVSILLNGKVILSKQGLSANAIKKTIYFTPDLGDSLQVIMYAENLGKIPPNTGVLILQDGDDRYEIRFAGDLQKNSAIILKRKQ